MARAIQRHARWPRFNTLIYAASAYDENNVTIEDHLARQGYQFHRTYCLDSFSTIKRFAISQVGLAVLPHRLAAKDLRAKKLRQIKVDGFRQEGFGPHTIYASFSSQKANDSRVKILFRALKGAFKLNCRELQTRRFDNWTV